MSGDPTVLIAICRRVMEQSRELCRNADDLLRRATELRDKLEKNRNRLGYCKALIIRRQIGRKLKRERAPFASVL